MDFQTAAQFVTPATNIILTVVFAIGYYVLIRQQQETLNEMREARMSGGRPQVIVQADYKRLPEVDLLVRNVQGGAAREIDFSFSAPAESSDGFVVSELPYFKEGLDFLEPGGEISCYWDSLGSLIPLLKEKGLTDGIVVTVKYYSLGGKSYTNQWRVNPLLFEGYRDSSYKGLEDLARATERISTNVEKLVERQDERQDERRQDQRQDRTAGYGPDNHY